MEKEFANGVWPVMLTPYTIENKIDYPALGRLTDWYIRKGCVGLFAVCQSSEMFLLSLKERTEIASFIKKRAGNIPVIASGHISGSEYGQIDELKSMADTGIDALILISNRLAEGDESDDVLLKRLERLMNKLPDSMPLGFYECPYPYKRLISPQVAKFCVESGRFYFLKDTSCDADNIREKLKIMKGSRMKLYNANTATLYESLKDGAAGFSGVMANFHPQLYCWLCENYDKQPQLAGKVSQLLTMCSLIERDGYPVNAKYAQQKLGNDMTLVSRTMPEYVLSYSQRTETEQLLGLTNEVERLLQ